MNWTQPGRTKKKLSEPYSTLWINVSSKSRTSVYISVTSLPTRGYKNGGNTFGRFVKLLGNTACWDAAIDDALRMAKGFLPVSVEPYPLPIKLLVPDDLSLSLIIFLDMALFWVDYCVLELLLVLLAMLFTDPDLVLELDELLPLLGGPLIASSGWRYASNLNCSML
jgi:hypothetical protein